jgi:hypothetical protein
VMPGPSGPLRDEAVNGTDVDVEILEDGEEGETVGSVPAAIGGQPDLTPVMYRIGRTRVIEEDLDDYIGRGLIKASMRDLCRAPG